MFAEPNSSVNGRVALGLADILNRRNGWHVHIIRPQNNLKKLSAAARRIMPGAVVLHCVFAPSIMDFMLGLKIPVIIACVDHYPHLSLPFVGTDNYLMGQMAAEHFLERPFHHFARIGYDTGLPTGNPLSAGKHISAARVAGYRDRLRKSNFGFDEILIPLADYQAPLFDHTLLQRPLETWLKARPHPCGIMTDDDVLGAGVVELALQNQIRVPEDVAVLGTGNEIIPCKLSQPNLSSIAEPFEEIGRKCASIILNWDKSPPHGRLICTVPPLGVVTRESTDVREIHDPIVSTALKFIADNIANSFNIVQLVKATGASRQTLIAHFKKSLRRTPIMEIRRQRVERAKCLLAETNENAKDIGKRCGINDPTHFSRVFKELTGITPLEYRCRAQNRNV